MVFPVIPASEFHEILPLAMTRFKPVRLGEIDESHFYALQIFIYGKSEIEHPTSEIKNILSTNP
jgi:hypothetical protein